MCTADAGSAAVSFPGEPAVQAPSAPACSGRVGGFAEQVTCFRTLRNTRPQLFQPGAPCAGAPQAPVGSREVGTRSLCPRASDLQSHLRLSVPPFTFLALVPRPETVHSLGPQGPLPGSPRALSSVTPFHEGNEPPAPPGKPATPVRLQREAPARNPQGRSEPRAAPPQACSTPSSDACTPARQHTTPGGGLPGTTLARRLQGPFCIWENRGRVCGKAIANCLRIMRHGTAGTPARSGFKHWGMKHLSRGPARGQGGISVRMGAIQAPPNSASFLTSDCKRSYTRAFATSASLYLCRLSGNVTDGERQTGWHGRRASGRSPSPVTLRWPRLQTHPHLSFRFHPRWFSTLPSVLSLFCL